jgi:hypothetical protein
MRSLTRRRLAGSCAAIAASLGLAAPFRAGAGDDPAPLSARLESSRWEGLSILYPPSVLDAIRPPADRSATIVSDVDRLVGRGGGDLADFEVTIGADDAAVGSAAEYVGSHLDAALGGRPPARVTYRARGNGWEVASGLIGGRVFYYKAVEFCAPAACDVPVVSSVRFAYAAAGGKGARDRLLERMVRTFTPARGRRTPAAPRRDGDGDGVEPPPGPP